MRVQIWKNKAKLTDEDPDYIIRQRQRTNVDDGSGAYETVQIGTGFKQEAPDGEVYIACKIEGFNDNKPKP